MHPFVLCVCAVCMFVHVAFWAFNLINIEIFSRADDK